MRLQDLGRKVNEDWAVSAGLGLGLLLILGAAAASILSLQAHSAADAWVKRTYRVREQLASVLDQLQDAEASQRGYIITGEERHLEPYHRAVQAITPELDRLVRMMAEPIQQERLRLLRPLVATRMAMLREAIDLRRAGELESAHKLVGSGQEDMDRIRALIGEVEQGESRLLAEREVVATQRQRMQLTATLIADTLGVLLVSATTAYAWRTRRVALSANEHLQESEHRFRALSTASAEVLYRMSPDWIELRQLRGGSFIADTEVPCRDWLEKYIYPEDRSHVRGLIAEAVATKSIFELEHRILRSDGTMGWTFSRAVPILNARGEIVEWFGAASDVTERKRMEERLRAANQELSDFATVVSHDLKAPLRAVATLAGWMQKDYADKLDAEGRENLAEMVRRVVRMDRMIEELLGFSSLGRADERAEPVALADLLPGVVQDLAPPERVHIEIAAGMPVVRGVPVRLRQLFQNLIGNAIKHGDKPEMEIRVDWADLGSSWQFSVADNGPGIEQRHFERIFKIFQTLAPKDQTDSTGVGLALVKRIVELGGGRVWVESRMGQGSTFHFTWPKAEARREAVAALQLSGADSGAVKGEPP